MVDTSNICEYENWYIDTKTGEYNEYSCSRVNLPTSEFCEFHDDEYYQTHEKIVQKHFLEELNEQKKDYTQPIYFIGCNIPSIKINKINQNRSIYFVNSKFHGEVEFFDTVFRTIDFTGAKFKGKFQMRHVDVSEIFLFTKTTPGELEQDEMEFELCNFNTVNFSLNTVNSISFKNCTFNFSKFRTTRFMNKMIVDNCTFSDKVDFSDVKFDQNLDILSTSFHSNVSFQYSKFTNPGKFHNVDFKEPQIVLFEKDLSNLSFVGTDITRVKFAGNVIWGGDDKYTVFDEMQLLKNPEKFNLSSVLDIYRNLRENYEFRLRYEEAGQFFVKEMELRRKYYQDSEDSDKTKLKKSSRYLSITNCYNVLSKYGESFKQVSIWSIILFFSALTYFYIYPDIIALDETKPLGDIDYTSKLSKDYLFRLGISLERTLSSFFQINQGGLADYVIRIASLPILGTMFIVLRRRFERRFRH